MNYSRVLFLLLVILAAGIGFRMVSGGGSGHDGGPTHCSETPERPCPEDGSPTDRSAAPSPPLPGDLTVLAATEICSDVGYLCSPVEKEGAFRVLRFPDGTGTLRIRIPPPGHEAPNRARELQQAAVRGVQAWQGHPFQLRILDRDRNEEADIEIAWEGELPGTALGHTRSRYRREGREVTYQVVDLTLATRSSATVGAPLTPQQVTLAAAHEMGHALGLPHSDDPRDVMYPTNTADRPSARDYRTLQAVYQVTAGAEIVQDR